MYTVFVPLEMFASSVVILLSQIPRALKLDLLEEAYLIVNKTYQSEQLYHCKTTRVISTIFCLLSELHQCDQEFITVRVYNSHMVSIQISSF